MKYIVSLLVHALAVIAASYLLGQYIRVEDFSSAMIVAFLLGILNATLGLILRFILNVATLGFFWVLGLGFIIRTLVSAVVIRVVDNMMESFSVSGFGGAILLAILLAIAGLFLQQPEREEDKRRN